MKIPASKIILSSIILVFVFASTNTSAEEHYIEQDPEGFCTSLRVVEKLSLTQRMREWRSELQHQKSVLSESVEKMKFSTVDAIITLVMPGGLLYAAVKRGNQLKRRHDLTLLTQDIEYLSGDLDNLESI